MIQLEYSAFSEATVPICTFVLYNLDEDYAGTYLKLSEFTGGMNVQKEKVLRQCLKTFYLLSLSGFSSLSKIFHITILLEYVKIEYKTVLKGFLFQVLASLIVIPIDYIFNYDFMMYKDLSSIPIFEDIASNLTNMHLGFINPFIMLSLYFIAFNIIFIIPLLVNRKKS